MSGEKRIISGQISQSKARGKALVKALGAFNNEANVGVEKTKTKKK